MDSKFIISSILTDLTLSSKTKFIEAKDNEDLIKLAKSKGIDLPSPDLACFETYYCELDKPNLNNAMLTKKAAEEGINTLVGKQINLNHQGKNYIIGYTIDAKIKNEMVVVIGILFKSLFPDEFDEIKQLFEEGKLFVSFELWNRQPETGESIIEEMANGVKKITKMIAHGVGLLLKGVKPACKKAQVFKLLANQKDNGEQIFQEDDRFAYASFINEVVDCTHCGKCNCQKDKEVKIMIKCEKCGKDFEASAEEKICVECTSLPKEEPKAQLPEETKAEVKAEETKAEETKVTLADETKPEETKVEVTSEVKAQEIQVIEPKIIVKVTRIYSEETVDTYVDGTLSGTSTVKGYSKRITEYKDGTKDEVTEEVEIKKKFDFAEVEEKVNAAKAEKDTEIATLKTEQEKILAEKDKEITNLKTELGTKDQEIADLKNPKVEPKKEKEMTVGAVDVKDAYKTKRESIDKKAYGEKK